MQEQYKFVFDFKSWISFAFGKCQNLKGPVS